MSTAVEDPTAVRELTRYVEREYPRLSTSYNARCEQVVVVGQPDRPEPPAALRENHREQRLRVDNADRRQSRALDWRRERGNAGERQP